MRKKIGRRWLEIVYVNGCWAFLDSLGAAFGSSLLWLTYIYLCHYFWLFILEKKKLCIFFPRNIIGFSDIENDSVPLILLNQYVNRIRLKSYEVVQTLVEDFMWPESVIGDRFQITIIILLKFWHQPRAARDVSTL